LVEHWSPKPGVGRSSRSSRATISYMKIKKYIEEAFQELIYKVSWPTWNELRSSAIVVMVSSLIIAMVIFLMDISFRNLLELIYKMF
jgi:preprotein translocase subunit SecE